MHAASDGQRFALIIQPTGIFRLLAWLSVSAPRHALCCDTARPVDLTTTLTVWVDEDAAAYGEKPNKAAHGLIRLYRPAPLSYIGDVVHTGTPGPDGFHVLPPGAPLDLELPAGRVRYPANSSMRHLVRPLAPQVSYRAGVLAGLLAGR